MSHNKPKPKTNKWLLWGVIILTTLLVLWLTFFEYVGAVNEGEFMHEENAIEQVQN